MAEKPAEEGYISVVDEEPEILQLLKWDNTPQIQKQPEPSCVEPEKPAEPVKKSTKPAACPVTDPFELSEPDFIETYRLTKNLVRELCEEIKPFMGESTTHLETSHENKVLATLHFYATGKHLKLTPPNPKEQISAHMMSSTVIQVTEALNHPNIVKKYIHFPHLKEEREMLMNKFYMKYGMPNVVGCVECTHVPISKPDNDERNHFNKSFHSQKVQIICDSDLLITSVEPCAGAQSHDGILNRHAVKVDLETLNANGEQCWLIGGPYYGLQRFIMTPIPKITKKSPFSPEKYYNTMHSQIHNDVMITIKHLKSRWKCLQATCNRQFDPTAVSMVIVACCVLHNICNRRGMPIPQLTTAEERMEAMKQKVANVACPKKPNDDNEALEIRAQLVQRLWSERRVPEGPKRRAKKEKKSQQQEAPQMQQQQQQLQQQPQQQQQQQQQQQNHVVVQHHQAVQTQNHCEMHDDPSKRPRLTMTPPSYVMPHVSVWGHYPPHH